MKGVLALISLFLLLVVQPCQALIIGYSYPQASGLGPELITVAADRDFSSDTTYWAKQAGVTISGGLLNFTNANNTGAYHVGVCTIGLVYQLDFDLTRSSGTITVGSNTGTVGVNRCAYTTTGHKTCTFTAYDTYISLKDRDGVNLNATVDNVSLRRVL